jgi:hypothetical protein
MLKLSEGMGRVREFKVKTEKGSLLRYIAFFTLLVYSHLVNRSVPESRVLLKSTSAPLR